MNVDQFIEYSLNHIHIHFPQTTLHYKYKKHSGTHFIQVIPKDIYDNITFLDLDYELVDQFEALGTGEELCFITEDSLVNMSDSDIISQGYGGRDLPLAGS